MKLKIGQLGETLYVTINCKLHTANEDILKIVMMLTTVKEEKRITVVIIMEKKVMINVPQMYQKILLFA